LVVNNILLTAALATVFLGTLFPLIMEATTGKTISVGAPYFLLTFVPLMSAAILILPFAIAMSWKRADLKPIAQRLMAVAALSLVVAGFGAFTRKGEDVMSALTLMAGLAMSAWLILGSLQMVVQRAGLKGAGVMRRLLGLPLSFYGMTLAHMGLGLFILGATYETHQKRATVEVMTVGAEIKLAHYTIGLSAVESVEGPNYTAVQARLRVKDAGGRQICEAKPERRFYPASQQATSEVALCPNLLNDLYFVLGEPHTDADGKTEWQVRALYNPLVHLIFFGPLVMLLGGLLSLSDRQLRLGISRKTKEVKA
jgi:cytochrome c-type biogenesis protein CcmF